MQVPAFWNAVGLLSCRSNKQELPGCSIEDGGRTVWLFHEPLSCSTNGRKLPVYSRIDRQAGFVLAMHMTGAILCLLSSLALVQNL
jgi:hypothetical protein